MLALDKQPIYHRIVLHLINPNIWLKNIIQLSKRSNFNLKIKYKYDNINNIIKMVFFVSFIRNNMLLDIRLLLCQKKLKYYNHNI
jgi:hypothetical protein